jgi:phosphate:Na+ symporter
MQSSSASIALILTAAMGGMLPLAVAAAGIIGANIGTTSTAAVAAIGATSSARRVAAAHVLFNVVEAVIALLLLPLMLKLVASAAHILALDGSPALVLALFHTVSKVLVVSLILPLTPRLVSLLERRFRSKSEERGRPRYLDRNVLATPALAIDAMALELARIGSIARELAQVILLAERKIPVALIAKDKQSIANLVEAVGQFAVQMQRGTLPVEFDQSLPQALGVARYFVSVADIAEQSAQIQQRMGILLDEPLLSEISFFRDDALELLNIADPRADDFDIKEIERRLVAMEDSYHSLKRHLLRAGSEGRIRTEQMVSLLEFYSGMRRLLQQAVKGGLSLYELLGLAALAQQPKEAKETQEEEPLETVA